MLLGIDVGGTFTDAVIIQGESIISKAKKHTTHDNILDGLLAVINEVVSNIDDTTKIKRVSLSTTLITNLIATGNLPKVSIGIIPGPGMNSEHSFPVSPVVFAGYTDHRGEMVLPFVFNQEQLDKMKNSVASVVSAKFAVRNPDSEIDLTKELRANGVKNIVQGHTMSGNLGFIRRTNSAYYTAATTDAFSNFIIAIKESLYRYNITAPLYVLKADGGTMNIGKKENPWVDSHTAETYFTGPAASAIGIKALLSPKQKAISLDIGGTTTDIAFWEEGFPLLKQRGASINSYPTDVRALHLRSVAIGGDSTVKIIDGQIKICPERLGQAVALGGQYPTVTDAFLVLGKADFGDIEKAKSAIEQLKQNSETAEQTAQLIINIVVEQLTVEIKEMIEEHALQPVYKVEDIVQEKLFEPELIIGVGGAAIGIVPALAEKLSLPVQIPQSALVANAVGAAVARPILVATLRADTALSTCTIPQANLTINTAKNFTIEDAKIILTDWLKEEAKRQDIYFWGVETIVEEEFPVVRGARRLGKIINLVMQLSPGVLTQVKEVE